MAEEALLIEIGCEEIPARMIRGAAAELARRVVEILDRSGLTHGPAQAWGGSRRLAVRVDAVRGRQDDREETLTGPPAAVGWSPEGGPTRAALGFARKQGIPADSLVVLETDRGSYVGVRRQVVGRSIEELLAAELPRAVETMPFGKTMRWSDGRMRWVRPVHWVLALYGRQPLGLRLFGIDAAGHSCGHRFRSRGPVPVVRPGRYAEALEAAGVVADPAERRRRIERALIRAAARLDAVPVSDEALLEEVSYLVEWPGVVEGRFDSRYLDLPDELLTTTLRHHQKCFSVRDAEGALCAGFLAVANTDDDPVGHIRRGNEWVVGGRLQDARFFWGQDRERPLASRVDELNRVVFHARAGSFGEKAGRMEQLADALGRQLGLSDPALSHCRHAARLAKADLTSSTVGEFPELQGRIGGLLLRAEGEPDAIADAVYAHYQPAGPDDAIPATEIGCIVAAADKLDSVASLVAAGELPRGSKDPLGLRRAMAGIFRIAVERRWKVSLDDLQRLAGAPGPLLLDLLQRGLANFLRERGSTTNEILAVLRPQVDSTESLAWPLHDITVRLEAIQRVRGREDFRQLVKLTQRVNNILTKESEKIAAIRARAADVDRSDETEQAALGLGELIEAAAPRMADACERSAYREVVEQIAGFIDPVERFFDEVLVVDERQPEATARRHDLVVALGQLLTRYFDIRELAGQADRSS